MQQGNTQHETITMSYLETIQADQASDAAALMYRQLQGEAPTLPNYARAFGYRPAVMSAWSALQSELKRHLDDKSYALICLFAARASGNSYCSLAYASRLLGKHYTEAQLIALLRRADNCPLNPAERAMVDYAEQVALDAWSVTPADIARLRESGFSDAAIFDIAAAAAGRCFFSRIPDALGIQPDASFGELDAALRSLVTVGREIEQRTDSDQCNRRSDLDNT